MTKRQFITIIETFTLSVFGFILIIMSVTRSLQASLQDSINDTHTSPAPHRRRRQYSSTTKAHGYLRRLRSFGFFTREILPHFGANLAQILFRII